MLTSFVTRPLRSEDRWIAVVALVVTAATHIPLVPMHMEEAPYVGWLFVALATASVVLAILLVVDDSPAVWWSACLTTFLAVVAFALSRTVALPQIGDDVGNWTEPLSYPAVTAEVVAAVVSVLVLRSRRSVPSPS